MGLAAMTELTELQKSIAEVRAKRGFVTDPVKIQVLLSEEVGEIAGELKRLWSKNYDDFSPERLKEEIADAFVLLAALANQFDIDIEQAVIEKFLEKDNKRDWKSALE
jgi:NTP pyrophosphatase (non-canonical NTP hydrolase)